MTKSQEQGRGDGAGHRFHAAHRHKLHSEERSRFQPASAVADLAEPLQPRDILDLGVGTGYFALPLLERLPEARVVGLDAQREMLDTFASRAKEAGLAGRIQSVLADLDQSAPWPVPDQSFDLVLAMSLVHELVHRETFARETDRILRPQGRLLVVDWNPEVPARHGPPSHHRLPRQDVISLMENQGFALESSPDLYEDFYCLLFKKA